MTAARIAVGLAALALAAGAAAGDPATLTRQGMADYDSGDLQAAITALSQAVRQNPQDKLAMYYLANTYWRLDENDRARPIFGKLAALDATGQLGAEARDWLSANGSVTAMSRRIRLPAVPAAMPEAASPGHELVASDGQLHLVPPDGFDEQDDQTGTDEQGDLTTLVFTRRMRGGRATFLVEAHYPRTSPSKADKKRAIEQLSDVTETLMSRLSVADYDIVGYSAVPQGAQQEIGSPQDARQRLRGMLRGAWSGDAFVVALALAPPSDWPAVRTAVNRSVATFKIAMASGSVEASVSATAGPTPTLDPDAPWWLRVQSQLASASPGLYPPPWGTPGP